MDYLIKLKVDDPYKDGVRHTLLLRFSPETIEKAIAQLWQWVVEPSIQMPMKAYDELSECLNAHAKKLELERKAAG